MELITSDSVHHAMSYLVIGGLLISILIFFLVCFIVQIFFCNSTYKVLKKVPEDKLEYPAYFAWLMLIPLAGVVFSWLTLPFNIPRSLGRVLSGNAQAEAKIRVLSGLGLTLAILETVSFIPYLGILASIPAIVVFIIYWVKLVGFRQEFLDSRSR